MKPLCEPKQNNGTDRHFRNRKEKGKGYQSEGRPSNHHKRKGKHPSLYRMSISSTAIA